MDNFSFHLPVRMHFGSDAVEKAGAEAAEIGKRVLLVYGKGSIHRTGVYDRLIKAFAGYDLEVFEFSGVSPNPLLSHAVEGAVKAKECRADVIVAAGGGSVIDEAKVISIGSFEATRASIWEYFVAGKIPQRAIPIIAVQTLPATSSETNPAAVITNDETQEKFSVRSPLLLPKAACLDPATTLHLPPDQTAYGCVDIMSHLLEGYFSHTDPYSPFQEKYALALSATVRESMDILHDDPASLDARSAVMWAGAWGWNGLGKAGWRGAGIPCHTLEHPLSGVYNLPHGAGLSIVIPAYLTYRREALEKRLQQFGRMVLSLQGTVDGEAVIAALKDWYHSIGVPVSFGEWSAVESFDIDLLVEQAIRLDALWQSSAMQERDFRTVYELMQ